MNFITRRIFCPRSFFLSVSLLVNLHQLAAAQSTQFWKETDASLILNDATRYSTPVAFRAVELDLNAMRALMLTAPMENLSQRGESNVIISIPMPHGGTADFKIWESPVMAPGLQSHYPNIRTYIAQGITDPHAVGRFDVTNFGFHAMILSPRGDVFVDPVSNTDDAHYIAYYKSDLPDKHDFVCGVTESFADQFELPNRDQSNIVRRSSGTELREYRLALACTGEYAATKGGTVSGALSGMTTSLNRVDGIYEQEVGIRMTLVDNDTLLIYTNAATDGFSNTNAGSMLNQNQSKCDQIIGSANYDIGHVFSTGGGGLSSLGCVCRSGQKAQSVTGSPNPVGDAYDVDYVAHEMGHEFGGNHTFNSTQSSCGGGNRWGPTAFEPGSGSTIMAYAGICGSDDLQPHSDPFFHSGSFDEIVDYTTLDFGNDCPVITQTGNTPPVVTVGSNYSIPLSTPFRLDADASDADGDSLAYMFDEMDHGGASTWDNPSGQAPLFRSFKEDTLKYRYFPKMYTIVNNYPMSTKGEVLADYGRTINFRFIARDHRAGGGGVTYNDVNQKITVVNTVTPFKVTFPNTALTWAINTTWGVLWDISSTTVTPINCQNVNILLSTDGGYTYPITLASNVPNIGSAAVTMPNDNSLIGITTARIMVQSVGNVFFDISDHNFSITNNVGISNVGSISSVVNVYPNPVSDLVNVEVNGLKNESLTIIIHDVVGRILFEQDELNAVGDKSFVFDLGNQPKGIYLVDVKTNQGNSTNKIVKQ